MNIAKGGISIMRGIIYDNYYWQNDLVRLRAWSTDDWKWDYYNNFDSKSLMLADCEISLSPTVAACVYILSMLVILL